MTWEAATVAECWQDLLDKDDRTSPANYPDMALITREELADYIRAGYEAARPEFDTVSEDDALRGGRWINADDVDRLVKEMDVAINGPNGAEHPKLCDLVNDVKHLAARPLQGPTP